MHPLHVHSIFIFYNPEKPGPHRYAGGLIYDHLPIYILSAVSDDDAYEQALKLGIKYRMCKYVHITGRTREDAEAIIERMTGLIGTETTGGPLKDFFEASKKKKTLTGEHKANIGRAMTGKSPSKATREKLSKANLGKRKPWLRGNENRAMSWLVTDPYSREYRVLNLAKFCREHGVPQGGLWAVAAGLRRHYCQWRCRRANMFN